MRITQSFIDSLSPVEVTFIKTGIEKLYKDKVTSDTTNYDNLSVHVDHCPHCGSKRYVKNGFNPKHRQKYRCKDCRSVFMATTGTLFSHSRTTFDMWSTFIAGELNSLTLQQQSIATELSVTTCFNMRHKLYQAASIQQRDVILNGNTELDMTYTKINLKGRKPEDMPRISKPRGKHKTSPLGKNLAGLSHHKVCIVTAIDEKDHIVFKIGGLGHESTDMLYKYERHFGKKLTVISDDSQSIKAFAEDKKYQSEIIPADCFTSRNGYSVSSVNELHTELKNLIRQKHGISTRHLQGYLDWLVFRKHLKYTLEMRKWKSETYMEVMYEQIPFTCEMINHLPMPIDLYEAYGEYHYGIFAESRLIN